MNLDWKGQPVKAAPYDAASVAASHATTADGAAAAVAKKGVRVVARVARAARARARASGDYLLVPLSSRIPLM